jgi:hypothetical protein
MILDDATIGSREREPATLRHLHANLAVPRSPSQGDLYLPVRRRLNRLLRRRDDPDTLDKVESGPADAH